MKRTKWWSGAVMLVALGACTPGEPVRDGAPAPPAGNGAVEERPDPIGGGEAAAAAAADLLVRAQLAFDAAQVEEALELARRILNAYGGTPSADAARWVGARAAFAMGDWIAARRMAAAYAASRPDGSVQAEEAGMLAELAADMLETPAATVRIGAVLPRTGSRVLVRYGDWVLEGFELAVREFEQRYGRTIELVVVDDGGGVRTRQAVAELEAQGVIAILGPLLPQQLSIAAASRLDDRLVLISPTVPDAPLDLAQVYTVNAGDTRGAQELATYAVEAGLTQAAVLHLRQADFQRKAQAFTVEFEEAGGQIRAVVPYDSGTTTFAPHMRRILSAVAPGELMVEDDPPAAADPYGQPGLPAGPIRPDSLVPADSTDPWHGRPPQQPFAVFVSAPERDVRQIAPQVAFYGLDSAGVQILGDEAWASAAVRRVIPARDLDGVIAAAHHEPDRADGLADPDFVRRYETAYRRSLDNQLPALGYDAAVLVLQALPNRLLTPAALAFRVKLLAGIPGATGRLSVRGQRVVRAPVLVVIRGGRLALAAPPSEYRLPTPRPPLPPPDTVDQPARP